MVGDLIFSGCGIVCSDCEFYTGEKEPKCLGCAVQKGKPFWGECPLYSCIGEHGVVHCGLCEEFPCNKFMDAFDPSQGPVSSAIRAGILAYRARHGDEKAVELVRKIKQ
jgi:hypothetical protein